MTGELQWIDRVDPGASRLGVFPWALYSSS
jgi:hypothetical protein